MSKQPTDKEIFMIQARKCLRCGRLLTSHDAVLRGYGCQCAAKARREERERQPIPGQITLDDWINQEGETKNGKSESKSESNR